jgi:hypothetical protein
LKINFNIILWSTPMSSKRFFFPRISPSKPCMHLSCLPYVPHAPPVSFFLSWSPDNIWWGWQNCWINRHCLLSYTTTAYISFVTLRSDRFRTFCS